ncbi:MAG TPA: HAD-IA family hydrolase, partial [Thermoplasmata archaeon]|nr:HAD-IA family hydrolase [Thermoplasmata archaeon]
ATSVLLDAPLAAGAERLGREELRRAFEAVYAGAVVASQDGTSVSPAAQIERAGAQTGRVPDPDAYLAGLRALVGRTRFQPAPGAFDVVRRLRDDGWATAVVSNTVGEPGSTLRPVLRRMGLEPLVDAFVFSDEGPWTKPAPQIFREALDRLGIGPDRAVHVGDGWVDIEGARRAQLRAGVLYTGLQRYGRRYRELFLPAGWAEPATPYRFASWPELPALLDRIL